MDPLDCDKNFGSGELKKDFLKISNQAHEVICLLLFKDISSFFRNVQFLEVDLDDILTRLIQKNKDIIVLFHDRY